MKTSGIQTTEAAENFLADERVRQRVDADRLMVNAVTAAVHLGTSRDEVKRIKADLGIKSRRCFIGPIRKEFRRRQGNEKVSDPRRA